MDRGRRARIQDFPQCERWGGVQLYRAQQRDRHRAHTTSQPRFAQGPRPANPVGYGPAELPILSRRVRAAVEVAGLARWCLEGRGIAAFAFPTDRRRRVGVLAAFAQRAAAACRPILTNSIAIFFSAPLVDPAT